MPQLASMVYHCIASCTCHVLPPHPLHGLVFLGILPHLCWGTDAIFGASLEICDLPCHTNVSVMVLGQCCLLDRELLEGKGAACFVSIFSVTCVVPSPWLLTVARPAHPLDDAALSPEGRGGGEGEDATRTAGGRARHRLKPSLCRTGKRGGSFVDALHV